MDTTTKKHIVSFKLTAGEKKALKEMVKNSGVSLSELIRAKSLATLNGAVEYRKQLQEKDKYISKLKIAMSYYSPKQTGNFIVLELTQKQKNIFEKVFNNYYYDNKPLEHQIIRYMAEDLLTQHHNLKEGEFKNELLMKVNAYYVTDIEYPFAGATTVKKVQEAFSEYCISGLKGINQLKTSPSLQSGNPGIRNKAPEECDR